MDPLIFLDDVEREARRGYMGARITEMEQHGAPVPGILFLIGYKPNQTDHLCRYTHEVMRGPSPLTPGQRELIAAFTSSRNTCVF